MERTGVSRASCIRAAGLREILDDRGIKYVWLAKRVGVSKSHLSSIIKGRVAVNPVHAEGICRTLGVPFFAAFECTKEGISCPQDGAAS